MANIAYLVHDSIGPAPNARTPRDIVRYSMYSFSVEGSIQLYRPLYTASVQLYQSSYPASTVNPPATLLFVAPEDFDVLTPSQAYGLLGTVLGRIRDTKVASVTGAKDILTIVRKLSQLEDPRAEPGAPLVLTLSAVTTDFDGKEHAAASTSVLANMLTFADAAMNNTAEHLTTKLHLSLAQA